MLTVAIGDIHGCYDQLMQLMEVIQKNVDGPYKLVFLGDYIDRGPASKQVLDYLIGLDNRHSPIDEKFKHVFLMGNHEDMAVENSPNYLQNDYLNGFVNWMQNGGDRTLLSYGYNFTPEFWKTLTVESAKNAQSYMGEYLDWLKTLDLYYKDSQRTYVHAGFYRAKPIEQQPRHVLMWIRDEFLHNQSPKGGYVVHGHTPVATVDMKPNRINLDTGCVFGFNPKKGNSTMALSAAVFDENQPEPVMILNNRDQVFTNFVDKVHI